MHCDLVHFMMAFALTCTCSQAASRVLSVTPLTTAKLIANIGNTTLLNRLRPLAAGTATIAGSFGGLSATPLAITIGSTAVTVSTVTLSATWCTSNSTDVQCGVTFVGLPGATNVLQVIWPSLCMACSLYDCMCMILMPADTDVTRHAVKYMMQSDLQPFSKSEPGGQLGLVMLCYAFACRRSWS